MATSTLIIFICIFICTPIHIGCNKDNGNITVTWDVMELIAENGYNAIITIQNYYQNITIEEPGWQLSWWWEQKEIILGIVGATVTETGDCSHERIKGKFPVSCSKNPAVVDLPAGNNHNQMPNCCKGGVLSNYIEGRLNSNSSSSFQFYVGKSGSRTGLGGLKKPKKVTLKAPGVEYKCGPPVIVSPIGALMTWSITCKHPSLSENKDVPVIFYWVIFTIFIVVLVFGWMVGKYYADKRDMQNMMTGDTQTEEVNEGINEGINERINERINEGINEQINEGINERINEQINEDINEEINEEMGGILDDTGGS